MRTEETDARAKEWQGDADYMKPSLSPHSRCQNLRVHLSYVVWPLVAPHGAATTLFRYYKCRTERAPQCLSHSYVGYASTPSSLRAALGGGPQVVEPCGSSWGIGGFNFACECQRHSQLSLRQPSPRLIRSSILLQGWRRLSVCQDKDLCRRNAKPFHVSCAVQQGYERGA